MIVVIWIAYCKLHDCCCLSPFNSRPDTSFFWFTSPCKTMRFIVWRRFKWIFLAAILLLLVILFFGILFYSLPVRLLMRSITYYLINHFYPSHTVLLQYFVIGVNFNDCSVSTELHLNEDCEAFLLRSTCCRAYSPFHCNRPQKYAIHSSSDNKAEWYSAFSSHIIITCLLLFFCTFSFAYSIFLVLLLILPKKIKNVKYYIF